LAAGEAGDGSLNLVFYDALGRPIDGTNHVRQVHHRLLRAAGLPLLRFHDMRHSAASLMLAGGIHPKIASERLGHSNVGITLDLYSHAVPSLRHDLRRRWHGRWGCRPSDYCAW
jgi:integrase